MPSSNGTATLSDAANATTITVSRITWTDRKTDSREAAGLPYAGQLPKPASLEPGIDGLDGNRWPGMSVTNGSEEYPMSFALIAIVCLLSLGLIFSRIRARKSAKPDFPRLFK